MGLSCLRAAILGLTLIHSTVWAQTFALGNPTSGSIKSGVGLISGWVCDAEELEVSFDGGARLFVPYGSSRPDTAYAPDGTEICGDTDNGFGLLWNYNELGDGPHTVTLYIDGRVATRVTFTVKTLGTNFLRGVTGQGTITLSDGKEVNVQWEETTQGFTITGYTGGDTASSDDAELRKLLGTWRVTATKISDGKVFPSTYRFLTLTTGKEGVRVVTGTLADGEGEWPLEVSLTADIDPTTDEEYDHPYVIVWRDSLFCYIEFIILTSPTRFRGESHPLRREGERCQILGDEPRYRLEGVRISGPQ